MWSGDLLKIFEQNCTLYSAFLKYKCTFENKQLITRRDTKLRTIGALLTIEKKIYLDMEHFEPNRTQYLS